jgi:hypothetical protein
VRGHPGLAAAILVCAACSFHAATGPSDAPGSDAGVPTGSIVEGSGGSAFGGTVSDGVVAVRDVLEPDVFVPGGLHALGYTSSAGLSGSSSADGGSALGSAAGESYGFYPFATWNAGGNTLHSPLGVGLAGQQTGWALALDGEILLDAGTTTIDVVGDDVAIVEIDTDTPLVLVGSNGGEASGSATATGSGWFPIHILAFNNNGAAALELSTGAGSGTAIDPLRLRARTTTATGMHADVAFEPELETLWFFPATALVSSINGSADPADWSTAIPSKFSVRYSGQLLIDVAGDHTFDVQVGSGDRYRLFVDNSPIVASWLTEPGSIVVGAAGSATVSLAPGWHAVVLDYGDGGTGSGRVELDMDGSAVGSALLRPTHPQGVVGGASVGGFQAPCAFTKGSADACAFGFLGLTAGAAMDYADIAYGLGGGAKRPNMTAALVASTGSGSGSDTVALPFPGAAGDEQELGGNAFDYLASQTGVLGLGSAATWTLTMTDGVENGTLWASAVGTIHGGDGAPFATSYAYTSQPYMLPDGAFITGARVEGALTGATTIVEIATAADLTSLGTAAFQPVGSAQIPVDELVAFRVVVTTDGWTFPFVSRVEIDYGPMGTTTDER